MEVPQDIAIIGFDDIEMSTQTAISMMSVRQLTFEIGKKAFEFFC